MITNIIFICLGLLTVFLLLPRWVGVAFMVPCLYLIYYFSITEIPKQFGYAVPIEFSQLTEAKVVAAYQGSSAIYVLLINKGESQPRLLSLEITEANKEELKQIASGLKKGQALVVKRGKGQKQTEGQGQAKSQHPDGGDLQLVPISEQTIIEKGS